MSRSPHSTKRVKLDHDFQSSHDSLTAQKPKSTEEDEEDSDDCCTICLQAIRDRTVVPTCSHEFCFECLLVWTEQSRRCPLCSQTIGEYLIHSIRSRYDYRKHYLTPLRTSSPPSRSAPNGVLVLDARQRTRRRQQERVWGERSRAAVEELDRLERSILKRRWVYEHSLYAKHVASNAFTKYRPYPTPAQFAASQDLISRTTTFLRRELQVWQGLDVEFLTSLILSLMKSIDIRSESAVKLMSEFLDMDDSGGSRQNAEHFTHEVYSYVRSPYKDLFVYDSVVQYDSPPNVPLPHDVPQSRWHQTVNQPSTSLVIDDYPYRRQSRQVSRSSTRSSPPKSPTRDHRLSAPRQRSRATGGRGMSEDSGRNDPRHELSDNESRERSVERTSPPTVDQRTRSSVESSAKGKELPNSTQLGTPGGESSTCAEPKDPRTAEHTETAIKTRPPRNQSLLESVKAHGTSVDPRPRDFGPAPTGSRRASLTTGNSNATDAPTLLARLSDLDPSSFLARLSDPQTSLPTSITTAVVGNKVPPGLTGRMQGAVRETTATGDATLNSLEARAKLLVRLNREKRQAQMSTDHDVPGDVTTKRTTSNSTPLSPDILKTEGKQVQLCS